TAAHTYADNGSYPVTLTLSNRFGVSTTAHATAVVSNVAPTVAPAADQSVQAGQALALTLATFTDPGFTFPTAGTSETFTATVNWGDGTAPQSVTPTVTNGSATTPTSGS